MGAAAEAGRQAATEVCRPAAATHGRVVARPASSTDPAGADPAGIGTHTGIGSASGRIRNHRLRRPLRHGRPGRWRAGHGAPGSCVCRARIQQWHHRAGHARPRKAQGRERPLLPEHTGYPSPGARRPAAHRQWPERLVLVGRWWIPDMWAGGGETPACPEGRRFALHHALVDADLAHGAWRAGLIIRDIADPTKPGPLERLSRVIQLRDSGPLHRCGAYRGSDQLPAGITDHFASESVIMGGIRTQTPGAALHRSLIDVTRPVSAVASERAPGSKKASCHIRVTILAASSTETGCSSGCSSCANQT